MIKSTSVHNTCTSGVSILVREWVRIPGACQISGLGRSTIYALLKNGDIASKLVKTSKHNVGGCRLVSVESLRAFIEESSNE